MATKGWLVGCGSLAVAGVLILLIGGGVVVQKVGTVRHDIEDANQRYVELNREFAFNPPANGELNAGRFASYIKVREIVDSAMAPARENQGIRRLMVLTTLPGEVSRAHVDALRRESMSIDEYRWITRQVYTTIAAEIARPDADASLTELAKEFESTTRRQGGVRVGGDTDTDPFRTGALDFTWLRVPDSTRTIVREHAADLRRTVNASLADQVFLNTPFAR